MTTFTTEELIEVAHQVDDGSKHTVERDGLIFVFGSDYDDESVFDYVNGMDALGRLGWPVYDRYTGRSRRPDGFTGAARKITFSNHGDTVWWEPYRDDHKVYDSPEDVSFMCELLEYGTIGLTLDVYRKCDCCDQRVEVARESLWSIESPLIGNGNHDYLAEVFSDLIHEATHQLQEV